MRIKKLTAILLSILTVFSVAACSKGGSDSSTDSNSVNSGSNKGEIKTPTSVMNEIEGISYEEGLHIINVNETEHKIVSNGTSSYKVVIPKEYTSYEQRAATEFRNFFRKATGVMLTLITDDQAEYTADSEYIAFGNVNFVDKANHGYTMQGRKTGGYVIKTTGKTVFVIGTNDIGTLHGAYELLYQLINWRAYSRDVILMDENVKNVPLKDFSICEDPDFEYSHSGYTDFGQTSLTSHQFRMYREEEIWMDNCNGHAIFRIMDPNVYKEDHRAWYSEDENQLCYTAHGDETEYDLMVNQMVENLKVHIALNRDVYNLSIAQNDVATWCDCDACKAVISKYGTNAATQMLFVNKVAEKLEAWLASDDAGEDKGRKINLVIFAYQRSIDPPVTKNADGTYSPVDGLRLHPMVSVWFAPLYASFTHGPFDTENSATGDCLKGWEVLADSIFIWFYEVNFTEYALPYSTFSAQTEWFAAAKKYNAKYLFNQGAWNSPGQTGFNYLKRWLNSKLSWNVSAGINYQALLDEFFDNFYGPASVQMRQYFDSLEAYMAQYHTEMGYVYTKGVTTKFWKSEALNGWLNMMDDALAAIEPLKVQNPTMYEIYRDNIKKESVAIRYLLISLYRGTYEKSEMITMVSSLADDIDAYSISQAEGTPAGTFATKIRALIN